VTLHSILMAVIVERSLTVYWMGSKLKPKAFKANFWFNERSRKDGIGDAFWISWAYKGYVVYRFFESR
jgi:hypothetical protein